MYIDSNGTRGIRFNGSAINNGSIIYVAEKYGGDSNGRMLGATDSNHYLIGAYGTRSRSLRIGNDPDHDNNAPSTTSNNTTPHIYAYHETAADQYSFYDGGVLVSQGHTDGIDGRTWALGDFTSSTQQSDMVISEFLVFDTLLTPQQRQDIEGYLAHKR